MTLTNCRPTLRQELVTYTIEVSPEEICIGGNASASGDDAHDAAVERAIRAEVDDGNVWAWSFVTVVARYEGVPGLTGQSSLGACSYTSQEDFEQSGYYYDMCDEARRDLFEQLALIYNTLTKDNA